VGRCRVPLFDNSGQKVDTPVAVWPDGTETLVAANPVAGWVAAPPVPGAGHRIDRTVAAALD
jgi:hypothetical protein